MYFCMDLICILPWNILWNYLLLVRAPWGIDLNTGCGSESLGNYTGTRTEAKYDMIYIHI